MQVKIKACREMVRLKIAESENIEIKNPFLG